MTGKFLRGFIDGSLSTLGIVIGASSASNVIIIAAALGGTLANGISNLLSAFSAEGVEQYKELRKIEESMVSRELNGSELDRQVSKKTITIGAIDGLATIIGGGIPILPYLFLPTFKAMLVAIGVVIVVISVIGLYLGKLSKRNMIMSAFKMAVFCIVVAALVYLVQSLIVPAQH
jgi:predicted membrane protein (TIGR00267 family)